MSLKLIAFALALAVASAECLDGQYMDGLGNCNPCSPSCATCSNAMTCNTCKPNSYRVATPDPDRSTCPCLNGFYEDFSVDSPVCFPCTASLFCKTCSFDGTADICTDCFCAQHRIVDVGGACICAPGYMDDPDHPGAPYCVREPPT